MAKRTIDESKLERMQECTNAQEVLALLSEEGFDLTDEQLEAFAGGAAANWSLEQLLESFDNLLNDLFPTGVDPKKIWSHLPMVAGH